MAEMREESGANYHTATGKVVAPTVARARCAGNNYCAVMTAVLDNAPARGAGMRRGLSMRQKDGRMRRVVEYQAGGRRFAPPMDFCPWCGGNLKTAFEGDEPAAVRPEDLPVPDQAAPILTVDEAGPAWVAE
jgi:hypothetical protein